MLHAPALLTASSLEFYARCRTHAHAAADSCCDDDERDAERAHQPHSSTCRNVPTTSLTHSGEPVSQRTSSCRLPELPPAVEKPPSNSTKPRLGKGPGPAVSGAGVALKSSNRVLSDVVRLSPIVTR